MSTSPGVPPVPYQPAKRIPADLPLVVHVSKKKYALLWGGLVAGITLLCGGPFALLVASEGGDPGFAVLLLLGIAALVSIQPVLMFLIATSGGPVLAADRYGLWIRSRKWPAKAIWLPWEAIEQIYLRRWGLDKGVCVKPHDPRAGAGQGAMASMDQGMQKLFYGAGFTATVSWADRPQAEIMQALAQLSAGRTFIRP